METRHAFVVATGVVLRMVLRGALLFGRDVLLHTDGPVEMVMMGNEGHYQHQQVDCQQQDGYVPSLFFHLIV